MARGDLLSNRKQKQYETQAVTNRVQYLFFFFFLLFSFYFFFLSCVEVNHCSRSFLL